MHMLGRILRFAKAQIPLYLRSSGKKPLAQQINEMLNLKKSYEYMPYQYLRYELYLKSFQGDIYDLAYHYYGILATLSPYTSKTPR